MSERDPQADGPAVALSRVPLILALLAGLAASLFAAYPAAAAAAAPACNSSMMYVVAHEDDTLLFQSPSILQDIRSGRCVRSVFLTAGDAGKSQAYWHSREEGAEAAYAHMAGVEDEWQGSTVEANGHSLPLRTLSGNPRVSLVFMRLPDGGFPGGSGYPLYQNQSLMKLWNGGNPTKGAETESTIKAVDNSSSYTYQGLVGTLTALIKSFEPRLIATQDYAETFAGADHTDHVATAYMTRLAQQSYAQPHQLLGYEDYDTTSRPQNVFEPLLESKRDAFYLYGLYDEGACSEEVSCSSTPYETWLGRQYVAASETTGVVANAGSTQAVDARALVRLDGSASSAANGGSLTYAWTQTAGPAVTLSGASTATPSFTAPAGRATLTFSLTVRSGVTTSQADSVTVEVGGSEPPVAAAGPPQTVSSGAAVSLDGSASSDPNGEALKYAWTQTAGPAVTLSGATAAKPTFTAPTGPATLTFSLVVSDASAGSSQPSTVTITVKAATGSTNVAPLATATASSEATAEGQTAKKAIDGVISGYPANWTAEWSTNAGKAGSWLSLKWAKSYTLDHVVLYDRPNANDQITAGTLTFSDGSTVSFGALPNTGSTGLVVSFSPRATTSLKMTVSTVSSTTQNVGLAEIEAFGVAAATPQPPLAAAGPPQTVSSGAAVSLDGSASLDPNGEALKYAWTQTAGPAVTLSGATAAKPTFTAPTGPATLTFSLVVSDASAGSSQPSTVTITVKAATGSTNVAPLATATASSEATAEGQTAKKAIDGVISGYPANWTAEWSTNAGKAGSWLSLKWAKSYTLDHVVLYDRPNANDQITAGTLTFSDGSTVSFGALPNTGSTGLVVSFSPRATTSLKMTVSTVSSTTQNVGLAEIEAFGVAAATPQPPLAAAGPPQTVSSGAAVSLDGSASSDPNGEALKYAWTQTAGPAVTLSGATAAKPTFTAPTGPATLTFSLVVSDASAGSSQPSTVTITVKAATGSTNVAPLATATASSEATAEGQTAKKAIDGVISGYPANWTAEWSTNAGKAGSWLSLKWAKSYTLDHVVLYDRPNANDQITAGTLTFSDGSTVSFGALPNTGSTGLVVSFSPRATTSLKMTVSTVSSTTQNVGLAEIEAFAST